MTPPVFYLLNSISKGILISIERFKRAYFVTDYSTLIVHKYIKAAKQN